MEKPEKIDILGVGFNYVDSREAQEILMGFLEGDKPRAMFTPNPEMVMLARKDPEFMGILNSADLVIPDGVGIVLASRLGKYKFKKRVTGCDTVQALFAAIKDRGKTVYFYGGAPGVAEAAGVNMMKAHPGLRVVGVRDGYINEAAGREMLEEIKHLKPDILIVGIGFPKQERWIHAHKDELPCKLLVGAGGSIDIMGGKVKRVPNIIGNMGFEWLYRLIKEPKRIKRQIKLPLFLFAAIGEKIKGG